MTTVIGVIIAVFCFMILIVGHEFGHFAVGKSMGMQINEFSVGMGPALLKKQGKETLYALRAVPIGGYCAFEGENEESDNPRAFTNQPWWSKIITLLAGPFMNILLGILIFACIYMYLGSATNCIGSTIENTPAYEAGLLAEDQIVAIDGKSVSTWSEVCSEISGAENDTIEVTVKREGHRLNFTVGTYTNDSGVKAIGIYTKIDHSFMPAFKEGVYEAATVFAEIVNFFRGFGNGTTSVDDVSGVVGIVAVVGETYQYGIINVIYIMAVISANLGFMNLLPIPALDGGRILLILVNKICGGKMSKKTEGIINGIGLGIMLVIMVLLIFKDTISLFK